MTTATIEPPPADVFDCVDCGERFAIKRNGGTGYASLDDDRRICYPCAGKRDRLTMIEEGTSRQLPLYLVEVGHPTEVTNWPGSLRFKVYHWTRGRHNIGRTRTDVWFIGPDGRTWHGYQIGDGNTICHAKRTKAPPIG